MPRMSCTFLNLGTFPIFVLMPELRDSCAAALCHERRQGDGEHYLAPFHQAAECLSAVAHPVCSRPSGAGPHHLGDHVGCLGTKVWSKIGQKCG